MNPKISVIMPVLNAELYLKTAIESVLSQTIPDFEFIIINDGSTDKTEEIIKSYQDPRIIYIKNDTNIGLSKSYNLGIRASKGEFIARMDADDISFKDRFESQLEFLEAHQEVGVVGGGVILIDESGKELSKLKKPSTHQETKWQSLFSTPIIHPTAFGRARVFKKNPYDENLYNSEDYELWSRILFKTDIKLANLTEALLYYRVHASSFTQSLGEERKQTSKENSIRNIEQYVSLSQREREIIMKKPHTLGEIKTAFNIYKRAAKEFEKRENFKPSSSRYFLTLIREFFSEAS